ncbi:hypothetical protein BJF79_22455 [Actinomadura sp. CNU-125]|nr:hypothetical protein BJF79_22455 [Actinomadura sp. CNU-125]
MKTGSTSSGTSRRAALSRVWPRAYPTMKISRSAMPSTDQVRARRRGASASRKAASSRSSRACLMSSIVPPYL